MVQFTNYFSQLIKPHDEVQIILEARQIEKKKLFANLNLSVAVILIFYTILYWYLIDYFAVIVVAVGAFILTPITIWLEKNNFPSASRVLFVISCHLYIYLTSLSMLHLINVEYFYYPAMLLPLLIFEITELKKISFCIFISLIFWACTHFLGFSFVPNSWLMPDPPAELLKPTNFLGATVVLLIFAREFVMSNIRLKDLLVQQSDDKGQILQKANEQLQQVADSLNEAQAVAKLGSWQFDPISKIQTWSKQMFIIFHREQSLGEPTYIDLLQSIHPEDRDNWNLVIENSLVTGQPYTMRCRLSLTEQESWIELKGQAIINEKGQVSGLFGTCQDITTEVLAQHKLVQSSKMSSLGEMAGGIAHEINNPLTIISGKVWQIKSKIEKGNLEPEKIIESLDMIARTTDRIAKIIKGLRSFSRNSDNDPMEVIILTQVIDETLELCRERFKNHSIEIKLDIMPQLMIKGRAAQLGQVLMNLLNNAHDAVLSLPEKWIELHVTKNQQNIKITVTDSGHGIPNHVVQKMMQPFFTTKDVGKGTGLGLSISKGIIEDHGGKLSYSAITGNTQFIIEIPAHNEALKAG